MFTEETISVKRESDMVMNDKHEDDIVECLKIIAEVGPVRTKRKYIE